jgi:hypothetical protein
VASPGAARVYPPFVADRPAGAEHVPSGCLGGRPGGVRETTLLAQWAERNGQAFAGVSVDEADNDPKVLLTYVAEALNAVEPVGRGAFDALASPASSVPGSVVPRLGSAFWSIATPVALVLDDVHLLRNTECRDALSVLADHVPTGSRLVLAGRNEPPLRMVPAARRRPAHRDRPRRPGAHGGRGRRTAGQCGGGARPG